MLPTPCNSLYLCPEEHGIVRLLLWRRPALKKRAWSKIRGTPAAWLALSLEFTFIQTVRYAVEAAADCTAGWIAVAARSTRNDASVAAGAVVAGMILWIVAARIVGAASPLQLCRFTMPSAVVFLFVCEEVLAAVMGARISAWHDKGMERCFRTMLATPLLEEIYFRVVLLHVFINRLSSCGTVAAASATVFAMAHGSAGISVRLVQFTAGLALALRFMVSGGNLLEVTMLHSLHNAAALAGSGGNTTGTIEWAPLALFGGMALWDAARMDLWPALKCVLHNTQEQRTND